MATRPEQQQVAGTVDGMEHQGRSGTCTLWSAPEALPCFSCQARPPSSPESRANPTFPRYGIARKQAHRGVALHAQEQMATLSSLRCQSCWYPAMPRTQSGSARSAKSGAKMHSWLHPATDPCHTSVLTTCLMSHSSHFPGSAVRAGKGPRALHRPAWCQTTQRWRALDLSPTQCLPPRDHGRPHH